MKRGRPPFSKLILFKALIIQSLYNLSDDQLEFQIVDRASFKCFVENSMNGSIVRTIGIARAKAIPIIFGRDDSPREILALLFHRVQYLSLCSVENGGCHGIPA